VLVQPHGPKLAFADGDAPVVTPLLGTADGLLVGYRCVVEPTQIAEAGTLFRDTNGSHPSRAAAWSLRFDIFETLAGLIQQRQRLLRTASHSQHAGQQETSHPQIVIGLGIRQIARRPGPLEQRLRAVECFAQLPAGKLLLDAGPRRLEPCVIPRLAQCRRRSVARRPTRSSKPQLAGILQQAVERSGQSNRRFRIPRAPHEVEQRQQIRQFQPRQRRRKFGVLALLLTRNPTYARMAFTQRAVNASCSAASSRPRR
jgi:hypothetical protein